MGEKGIYQGGDDDTPQDRTSKSCGGEFVSVPVSVGVGIATLAKSDDRESSCSAKYPTAMIAAGLAALAVQKIAEWTKATRPT